MEIGSDRRSESTTLVAASPVIPVPVYNAAERVCSSVEFSSARVILEAGDMSSRRAREIALEQHIADESPLSGSRVKGKQAGSGHLCARNVTIRTSKKLIPAAYSQQRASSLDEASERRTPLCDVGSNQLLVSILAPADVYEIGVARKRRSFINGNHRELDITLSSTPAQHCDIAPVRVNIEQLRVKMGDRQLHDLTR